MKENDKTMRNLKDLKLESTTYLFGLGSLLTQIPVWYYHESLLAFIAPILITWYVVLKLYFNNKLIKMHERQS